MMEPKLQVKDKIFFFVVNCQEPNNFVGKNLVSEYIKNSNSTASTKRRIISRKESSGNDSQELHYFNTSIKKSRKI